MCGEAAGEAEVAALLVGLDVDELSVAPARLDEVREVVRLLSMPEAADAVKQALVAPSAHEALGLARDLLSAESRHETDQVLGGLGGAIT